MAADMLKRFLAAPRKEKAVLVIWLALLVVVVVT